MSKLYPIGSILPYGGSITTDNETELISAGYIPCDGRQLSRSDPQYAELFKQIKTYYGGTENVFCVPDYRGRFMRGTDLQSGNDPDASDRTTPTTLPKPGNQGDKVGSLQQDALQGHTHSFIQGGNNDHYAYNGKETPGTFLYPKQATGTSSSFGGTETRPKNAYINYLIVYM